MALCFPRKDLFKNGPIGLGIKGSREELKHNLTTALFSHHIAEKCLSSGLFSGSAAPWAKVLCLCLSLTTVWFWSAQSGRFIPQTLHLGDKPESSQSHFELRSTVMCIYLLSPPWIIFRCIFSRLWAESAATAGDLLPEKKIPHWILATSPM